MKASQRTLDNLKDVHPDLVSVILEALETTENDFTVTEGIRTTERQQELYSRGRTKPGRKVTWTDGITRKSKHQKQETGYSHAVDLYPYYENSVHTKGPEAHERLKKIAVHIKKVAKEKKIKITWGGDWGLKYDAPHFQIEITV